jgi:2-dehydro-3-deoxyphosphogalactonate aldolase
VLPVGGITPDKLDAYVRAGTNGFGLGSALYQPGMRVEQVAQNAAGFVKAIRSAMNTAH